MRLSDSAAPLLLGLALLGAPGVAHAADPGDTCTGSDGRTFPLSTEIRGGPDRYEPGGGYGTWYLDLTNKTGLTCRDVHPVVVLVDERRALEPDQPQLEFYAGGRAHPVRFETTDEDELVGPFEGFPGFTVGPRETVSVKVRLALTSEAAPNRVTVNAAVVQRHDDDGEWIGQSGDYRFGIGTDPVATEPAATGPAATSAPRPTSPDGEATGGADPGTSAGATPPPLDFAGEELASTGTPTAVAGTVAALLVAAGSALLFLRRRR
ncbi:LPXTG cell wall anchor domain-containing protein [Streptomyces sp. NPDC048002]|uniref:LPXTG cell wall anchor domain-containing protein n=1 Tax=Streptomyces sp. NPDC048002 TaxID=3154344 RepID=UPI0033FE74C4